MKSKNSDAIAALSAFDESSHELKIFMQGVSSWFLTHPKLTCGALPHVHSVKQRLKDREHLKEKINRKISEGAIINGANLSRVITDLAGIRLLHVHQEQAKEIHSAIMDKVNVKKDWSLHEKPKAYTWDPESKKFFETMGLEVLLKESFYTSVHYVIRPKPGSSLVCEIQVRTLFEEIWGEVDHSLNYPVKSTNISCREQLLVLAKVVGAGSRLLDSIFRTQSPNQCGSEKNLSNDLEITKANDFNDSEVAGASSPVPAVQPMRPVEEG